MKDLYPREPGLSVIVPVYNTEKTLRRCVDSLLRQDYGSLEILLIDDGSTDGSAALADEIARNAPCVRVFHKPNGGLSDARNYGVERAGGEYLAFVDSDDELTRGLLASAMAHALACGCDLLEFPVVQKGAGGEAVSRFSPETRVFREAMDWAVSYGLEHCWAWNKIYRRWIFGKVRFRPGIHYEDVVAMAEILKLNPVIAGMGGGGAYIYHLNGAGITAESRRRSGLAELLEAQQEFVRVTGIDTREPRFHRIYVNMMTSQLYAYRSTGRISLWPQRVRIRSYGSAAGLAKAVMIDTIGLELSCKLFKLLSRQ